jgi:hypothetical protein
MKDYDILIQGHLIDSPVKHITPKQSMKDFITVDDKP